MRRALADHPAGASPKSDIRFRHSGPGCGVSIAVASLEGVSDPP